MQKTGSINRKTNSQRALGIQLSLRRGKKKRNIKGEFDTGSLPIELGQTRMLRLWEEIRTKGKTTEIVSDASLPEGETFRRKLPRRKFRCRGHQPVGIRKPDRPPRAGGPPENFPRWQKTRGSNSGSRSPHSLRRPFLDYSQDNRTPMAERGAEGGRAEQEGTGTVSGGVRAPGKKVPAEGTNRERSWKWANIFELVTAQKFIGPSCLLLFCGHIHKWAYMGHQEGRRRGPELILLNGPVRPTDLYLCGCWEGRMWAVLMGEPSGLIGGPIPRWHKVGRGAAQWARRMWGRERVWRKNTATCRVWKLQANSAVLELVPFHSL